uniref:JmjC domain-containing protein n=1 Tax=Caenorhabditis tropicalis TaxID=1561998 RepID=A0A1I7U8U7_9PELO
MAGNQGNQERMLVRLNYLEDEEERERLAAQIVANYEFFIPPVLEEAAEVGFNEEDVEMPELEREEDMEEERDAELRQRGGDLLDFGLRENEDPLMEVEVQEAGPAIPAGSAQASAAGAESEESSVESDSEDPDFKAPRNAPGTSRSYRGVLRSGRLHPDNVPEEEQEEPIKKEDSIELPESREAKEDEGKEEIPEPSTSHPSSSPSTSSSSNQRKLRSDRPLPEYPSKDEDRNEGLIEAKENEDAPRPLDFSQLDHYSEPSTSSEDFHPAASPPTSSSHRRTLRSGRHLPENEPEDEELIEEEDSIELEESMKANEEDEDEEAPGSSGSPQLDAPSTSSADDFDPLSLPSTSSSSLLRILSQEEFRRELMKHKPASKEFMELFVAHEAIHFNNGNVEVEEFENGYNYREKLGDFTKIYKFQSREGLGMKKPEIGFERVAEFFDPMEYMSVIDSRTQRSSMMPIHVLLDSFKIPVEERTSILNLLSLEFTKTHPGLNDAFKVPSFVEEKSIIHKIEGFLKEKAEEIEKEMATMKNKKELKDELRRLQKFPIPRYQKFFLISMEGSFTDIHVDFSATSVYYHVDTGKKVFYVAPPTPDNVALYERIESKKQKTEEKDRWIGDLLFEQWRRVEINPGETLMMPSGYLHFVYTPEDSLVIGGNFLMEQYYKLQFQLTDLEEYCHYRLHTIGSAGMLRGFRDVMWAYIEFFLIPKMREMDEEEKKESPLRDTAELFVRAMKPTGRYYRPWYKPEKREELKRMLQELMGEQRGVRRRPLEDVEGQLPAKRRRRN